MVDLNTWRGTGDYNLIAQSYSDAWTVGQSAGTATSYNGTGYTHGGSTLDYVFYSNNGVLSLVSVDVPSPAQWGVDASDHAPVVAVFRVN
jgi:endonuclease/exonuclease/phosphatase family metal-dependent hydrolase